MRALARVRSADEFKPNGDALAPRAPTRRQSNYSWTLERIRDARDDQMHGKFELAVELAEALRTDDALFVAWRNRIAPQDALEAKLVAHGQTANDPASTRAESVARKAAACISAPRSVIKGIHGRMADHGIAIGVVRRDYDDAGTRVYFRVEEWPLEHVYWDTSREQLFARVRGGPPMPIVHGDGLWVVFRKFTDRPWVQDAALVPASFVWAAHSQGIESWGGATDSHGRAALIGELPEGVSTYLDGTQTPTPEAEGFLAMLQAVVGGEVGIRPSGSKTEVLYNGSNAWQVFKELILNREKAAARIYLGTDATLGSVGGAPGVDISALFDVASTILQGDLEAIEEALRTGVYEPWTAINYGDSTYAPHLQYQIPDPDKAEKNKQSADARDRLLATIKDMREQGMIIDQDTVTRLAAEYGVDPPPQLASAEKRTISIPLAPTDMARVVRVIEARSAIGLPPLGDKRDQLFISELEAQTEADADIAVEDAPAPPVV